MFNLFSAAWFSFCTDECNWCSITAPPLSLTNTTLFFFLLLYADLQWIVEACGSFCRTNTTLNDWQVDTTCNLNRNFKEKNSCFKIASFGLGLCLSLKSACTQSVIMWIQFPLFALKNKSWASLHSYNPSGGQEEATETLGCVSQTA